MATSTRRRWFMREPPGPSRAFPAPARIHLPGELTVNTASGRALTAAATPIDLNDRNQARRMRVIREGWQNEAWAYRQAVAEVRFAFNFLANCAKRMRLYPAAYDITGESDDPVALAKAGAPQPVIDAANVALAALGNGPLALGAHMHSMSTNVSVAGEAWLLGQEDPATGREVWTVRSVSEIGVRDDRYFLREVPADSQGAIGWVELDPDTTVLVRMWVENPQFRQLADSAMRTLGDTCEGLLILRRGIRASGRSRLAGAGVLAIPEELQLKRMSDDNEDPQSDDLVGSLAEAMMTSLAEEGVASAVVPIFLQGPGEFLDKIKLINFATGYDKEALSALDYLSGVFATGVDLPKMVVTGAIEEANHWTAWSVSADTFRHYVEPHVQTLVHLLTTGYLRPSLIAAGVPQEWVDRILLWYDPVDLVAPPNKAQSALDLHNAFAISDQALREANGYTENDKPDAEELQTRMFQHIRTFPLNLLMEWARELNPALIVPPMAGPPAVPGIKPGGVDVATPALPPGQAAPATADAPPPAAPDTTPTNAPPTEPAKPPAPPSGITASAARPSERDQRLSRQLAKIDADLRARLRVAANTAMLLRLQRAGGRVKNAAHGRGRTVAGKNDHALIQMARHPNINDALVAAAVGQRDVEAMGMTADQLLGKEWATLKAQFYEWTEHAQQQAVATASRLAGIDATSDTAAAATATMAGSRDAAWAVLAGTLTSLSHELLYNPDPNVDAADLATVNLNNLVPTGVIRAALGVAGGQAVDAGGAPVGVSTGQIGTGGTISGLLEQSGATMHSYQWEHGPSIDPFDPHLDLDGVQFAHFDDEQLANTSGWPDNSFYLPGDHSGCLCDAVCLWVSASAPDETTDDSSTSDDAGDGEGDAS